MPKINITEKGKYFSRSKTLANSLEPVAPEVAVEEPVREIDSEENLQLTTTNSQPEAEAEENLNSEFNYEDVYQKPDEEFLEDLTNGKFVSASVIQKQEQETEKERKAREKEEKQYEKMLKDQEKQREKEEKQRIKEEKQLAKEQKQKQIEEDDDMFSKEGSELYGRDKRQLIKKIEQYKILFPENKNLQSLKIKKKATVDELHQYLAECEAIVETDTVDGFMTEATLKCIGIVEGLSVYTKYNISGLSEMLQKDPKFTSLCKQLWLKYKIFSRIPIEYQLAMTVTFTASLCYQKNKNKQILSTQVDPKLYL